MRGGPAARDCLLPEDQVWVSAASHLAPRRYGSPRIRSFSAAPVAAGAGDAISLTWDAVGEEATLRPLIGDTPVGCRCLFGLPPAGSVVVEAGDIIGAYTGFRLTVEAGGVRVARYAPLVVECPHRFSGWCFADPPGMCPQEPPLASPAATQRFEHGMMIWIEKLGRYYVMYDRFVAPGEHVSTSVGFTSLLIVDGPLDLAPGASPDNRVDETPPHGRFEPVVGLGLVWGGGGQYRRRSATSGLGRRAGVRVRHGLPVRDELQLLLGLLPGRPGRPDPPRLLEDTRGPLLGTGWLTRVERGGPRTTKEGIDDAQPQNPAG